MSRLVKVGCRACGQSIDEGVLCPHCGTPPRPPDPSSIPGLNDRQRAWVHAEMTTRRKSGTIGVLLALLLGGIGGHHFYLHNYAIGVIYLLFCWTFVPAIIAFVEMFLMPERVRQFNRREEERLAAQAAMMTTP